MNFAEKIVLESDLNRVNDPKLISLDEVKLSRIIDYHFKNGSIIVSACRAENDEKQNKILTNKLLSDITSSNYSYIPVFGGFIEKNEDEEKEVKEASFLF